MEKQNINTLLSLTDFRKNQFKLIRIKWNTTIYAVDKINILELKNNEIFYEIFLPRERFCDDIYDFKANTGNMTPCLFDIEAWPSIGPKILIKNNGLHSYFKNHISAFPGDILLLGEDAEGNNVDTDTYLSLIDQERKHPHPDRDWETEI